MFGLKPETTYILCTVVFGKVIFIFCCFMYCVYWLKIKCECCKPWISYICCICCNFCVCFNSYMPVEKEENEKKNKSTLNS